MVAGYKTTELYTLKKGNLTILNFLIVYEVKKIPIYNLLSSPLAPKFSNYLLGINGF